MDNRNLVSSFIKPIALMLILISVTALACGGASSTPSDESFSYQVRVLKDGTNEYIPNARVTIEVGGLAPLEGVTDVNGVGRILIDISYVTKPARLLVDANGYGQYRREIDLIKDALPDTIFLKTALNESIPTSTPMPASTIVPASTPEPIPTNTQPIISSSVISTPTLIPVTSWPITLILNEERKSPEVQGFYLIINKVEIFEDGRMRWFISFWNKSDQDLGFDLGTETSYIADDFGKQYTIVNTNYSKSGLAGIKKGVREDYWFDFSNISGQPDNFLIVLDNYYTYADYQINLRLNLSRFQPFSNATSVISTNSGRIIQKTIDLNLSQESPENNKFLMLINKVDIFDDGRMRLYVSYWNKTNNDVGLDISLPDTYFTDTTGKQYSVVDTDYPKGGKNIPQGVRVDYWLEFDAPVSDQTDLTFNTNSYYFIGRFPSVTISLRQ